MAFNLTKSTHKKQESRHLKHAGLSEEKAEFVTPETWPTWAELVDKGTAAVNGQNSYHLSLPLSKDIIVIAPAIICTWIENVILKRPEREQPE